MLAMSKTLAVAGMLVSALTLAACGGDGEDTAAPTETVTVTSPAPDPATAVATTSEAPPEPEPELVADVEEESTTFTMPLVVGLNLQKAQDHLQEVSDNPAYFSTSHDVSGDDRMQLWDRSWKVCTQNVKPGKTVGEKKTVDLGVVKTGESC